MVNRENQRGWRTPRRGRLVAGLLVMALVVGGLSTVVIIAQHQAGPVSIPTRDDPVRDLLAWLPANAETKRHFAFWVADDAQAGTPAPEANVDTASASREILRDQQILGLSPFPRSLGLSVTWRDRFGWDATDITGWAAAGNTYTPTAVLVVEFDANQIINTLEASGFTRETYLSVSIYSHASAATPVAVMDGDTPTAAVAVAILPDRLITAASAASVRAALDAGFADGRSLADTPTVNALLDATHPVTALTARDASAVAATCLGFPQASATPDPAGRMVAVGYRDADANDPRRTLVALTVPDGNALAAIADAYDVGWLNDPLVITGDAVAAVAVLGQVDTVSRHPQSVVAELTAGRASGWAEEWVPAAIQYAEPVCEAVAGAFTPPIPPADPGGTPEGRLTRALNTLPELGEEGHFAFADLAAITTARGLSAPVNVSDDLAVAQWWEALGPLPPLAPIADDPAHLAEWPAVFGFSIETIDVIASVSPARRGDGTSAAAVLHGRWDPAAVDSALLATGYQPVPRDGLLQYRAPSGDADAPHRHVGGVVWDHVALLPGELVLATDETTLRQILDSRFSRIPAPQRPASARAGLIVALPGATSGEVFGGVRARQDCAARGLSGQAPMWTGLALLWRAGADNEDDVGAIVARPATGQPIAPLIGALDAVVPGVPVAPPPMRADIISAATPGVPDPAEQQVRYGDLIRYDDARVITIAGLGEVVMATVTPGGDQADIGRRFYATYTGACPLLASGA